MRHTTFLQCGALLAILTLLSADDSLAQPADVQQAVHFELFGSGILPTVNYERSLNENWIGRAGFSFMTTESESSNSVVVVLPITVSYVTRPSSNHHFELGGGATFVREGSSSDLWDEYTSESSSGALATGIVGYRYQKPNGGFQFRAVATPMSDGRYTFVIPGFSFGYSWGKPRTRVAAKE